MQCTASDTSCKLRSLMQNAGDDAMLQSFSSNYKQCLVLLVFAFFVFISSSKFTKVPVHDQAKTST